MFLERGEFISVPWAGYFLVLNLPSTGTPTGETFLAVLGFARYGLFDEDEPGLYWALSLGVTAVVTKRAF